MEKYPGSLGTRKYPASQLGRKSIPTVGSQGIAQVTVSSLQPCSRKRLNYQGQFSCSLPAAAQPSGPEDTQSQAVAKNTYHMEQLVVQIQVEVKADKEAQATVDPEDQE